jgi:DNA-binding cell septation regulator SpoVG
VGAEASTAQGTFLISFSINETVGLVLNNARVSYLLDKEFIVKNIKVVKEENSILFSFNALANEENIELNILKSQNGKDFKTIKTIQLLVGQNEESINFTDEYSPMAIYKIEITKNKTIQRYLSKAYHFNHVSENFKVFPSISKDIVHVNFEKMNKEVSYQIINTQGQMQQKGFFTSNFNTIDIHNLASGIYYVVLNINQQLFSTKIIKQ